MIEKLLNKIGYIKSSVFEEGDFPTQEEEKLFRDLSSVDGFQDYLNSVMSKDMKRYFVAETPDQQNLIKGGFSRMVYFKTRLEKSI